MIFILFPTTCTASLYCKLSLSDQDMKAWLYFRSVQFVVNPWFPAVNSKICKKHYYKMNHNPNSYRWNFNYISKKIKQWITKAEDINNYLQEYTSL